MSAEADRWREVTAMAPDYLPEVRAGDALLAALEARDQLIAELEAGLRAARPVLDRAAAEGWIDALVAASIARDLLAGRAAGGEAKARKIADFLRENEEAAAEQERRAAADGEVTE